MKILLKIGLTLFSLVVFFLIVVLGVFIYNKSINHVAYIGNYTSFAVTGKSMEPELEKDDFIIVKKEASYNENDVITFRNDDGGITTHRIIVKDKSGYTTRGDNNNFTDGYKVQDDDVYGKVIVNIKGLNTVLRVILKYKFVFITIVIAIPIIFKFLIKVF